MPALRISSSSGLNAILKQQAEPLSRKLTLRTALVVLQVAISVLVLVCAGLMVRASLAAEEVDPGFRSEGVLLASFNPGLAQRAPNETRSFYQRLVEQMRAQPGVSSAGLTRYVPLGVTNGSLGITIDGAPLPDGQDRISVAETVIDPGTWRSCGYRSCAGRPFRDSDTDTTARVAIVNETLANQYWPDGNPIGKSVRHSGCSGTETGHRR